MGSVVLDMASNGKEYEFIVNKYDKLKADRGTWETHWQDLANHVLPEKNNIFGGEVKGEKKGQKLFDAIGIRCNDQLASALHSMLTNPATQWFSFSTGTAEIDNKTENAKWLQDVAKKMLFIMNNTNFQPEIHEVFLDLCGLGTSHLLVEEDEKDIVRYTSRPIYEVVISENYKGKVDTIYYKYKNTLEQLCEQFPESLPREMMDKRHQEPLKEYTVICGIEPSSRLPKHIRHAMLPYTSLHVLEETRTLLKTSGFEEDANIISRFSKLSGEMYGRSPAMKGLPDIKTCNQMKKVWLEGAQLTVNPALQAPDEGVLMPIRLTPGAINYYRADSKDRIEPINIGANPVIGHQIIEMLHQNIKSSFFIDQLHLVENDRMTATEVMQRRDEQLRSMSPILGRLQNELLSPLIMRTFWICMNNGHLPAMPSDLAKAKLEVRFVSQIARAQESVEGDNFMRALQASAAVIQLNPETADIINGDESLKYIFRSYGAPLGNLRKDSDLKKFREVKAQQAQQAQQAQLNQMNSQTEKNMAQANSLQQG